MIVHKLQFRMVVLAWLLCYATGWGADATAVAEVTKKPESSAKPADAAATASPAPKPVRLEARCIDGSVLKLTLVDGKIPFKTDYGQIEIPVADIIRIEFATRVSPAIQERMNVAIKNLGSEDYKIREAASAELLALKSAALPALTTAASSSDAEVAYRAEQLLDALRGNSPEEEIEPREYDIIHTDKSKLGGTIATEGLSIQSELFGKQKLALEVVRTLQPIDEPGQESGAALPDPGNLFSYQNQAGRTLYFRVTGPPANQRRGYIWGTDVYTLDSTLAMAAVHAGVLRPGETKVLAVTLTGPQNNFAGSLRNGMPSADFGAFPGGYRFKTARAINRAQVLPQQRGMQVAPPAMPLFNQ